MEGTDSPGPTPSNQDLSKQHEGSIEETINDKSSLSPINDYLEPAKWINNKGEEVYNVFGFNENAELVNGRTAMVSFILLLLTEQIYGGLPVTKAIFGIG